MPAVPNFCNMNMRSRIASGEALGGLRSKVACVRYQLGPHRRCWAPRAAGRLSDAGQLSENASSQQVCRLLVKQNGPGCSWLGMLVSNGCVCLPRNSLSYLT